MPATSIVAPFAIFQQLKSATADIHRKTERQLPVFEPEFGLAAYIEILERFYGFWTPLEEKLLRVKPLMHPVLALQTRMKSHLLRSDLRILGVKADCLPQCANLPAIDTFPAGLGCLYVLEGSTLGARIISRRIESHLQLREDSGAAFFNAYGEATGQRWSEFQQFVTAHLSRNQSNEAVTAAVQTFESLFAWLT